MPNETTFENHVLNAVRQWPADGEVAYDMLVAAGPESVVPVLSMIIADQDSSLRFAAIHLLELMHANTDASDALPVLREAMQESDEFLRLYAAQCVCFIQSNCDIQDIPSDALAVVVECSQSNNDEIKDNAEHYLELLSPQEKA